MEPPADYEKNFIELLATFLSFDDITISVKYEESLERLLKKCE